MNLNNLFIKTLKDKQLTLALAESVTCGLASHKLSTCKGISDVLTGSIVCYTPQVKLNLLKVSKTLINTYTCESTQVTEALAKKLSRLIDADIHAAITGLASAGGTETKKKPVGTIFFSMKYKGKVFNEKMIFKGSPLTIREKACDAFYKFILSRVK